MAIGCTNGDLRFWDAEKRQQVGSLDGHLNQIDRLTFTPDQKQLVSIAEGTPEGMEFKVWDLETKIAVLSVALGEAKEPTAVAFSKDHKTLLVVDRERRGGKPERSFLERIDLQSGKVLASKQFHISGPAVFIEGDQRLVYTASKPDPDQLDIKATSHNNQNPALPTPQN